MGTLDTAVRRGKALYAGISSYSAAKTREAAAIMRGLGTPLLIHQPSYSMLNRWIEPELLDVLGEEAMGCIASRRWRRECSPTNTWAARFPPGSRASRDGSLSPRTITDETLEKIRALDKVAKGRGQTLAQMAIAWTLRDPRVTSALVGASSVEQLEANVAALDNLDVADDELVEIDRDATEGDINIWAESSRV